MHLNLRTLKQFLRIKNIFKDIKRQFQGYKFKDSKKAKCQDFKDNFSGVIGKISEYNILGAIDKISGYKNYRITQQF